MKKVFRILVLLLLIALLGISATKVLIRHHLVNLEYYYGTSDNVSVAYQNHVLKVGKINEEVDYNYRGQPHVGLVVSYRVDNQNKYSEIIGYDNDLLVLFNGDTILSKSVTHVARISDSPFLYVVNTVTHYPLNYFLSLLIIMFILGYGIFLVFAKKQVSRTISAEYSSADLICYHYMTDNNISFLKDDFVLADNKLNLGDIVSYVKNKRDLTVIPGVGKNPTSLKVNHKKSFALIYQENGAIRITFKCGPLIGEEIAKVSGQIVKRSNFPHGSVWFAITNINTIKEKTLYKLLDVAYQLAAEDV